MPQKKNKSENSHKLIFNSSEKSNFILNMTREKYSAVASKILALGCFIISIMNIFSEHIKVIEFTAASAGLTVIGVMCMIYAIIALMKKYTAKSSILPVAAFGFFLVWTAVSLCFAYDLENALYGFTGRGEGLLSTVFYMSIFITALNITEKKDVQRIFDAIVLNGLLGAVYAILQYCGVFNAYGFGTNKLESVSGLSKNPIFFAMTIGLSMIVALTAVKEENKIRNAFYLITACLCGFVSILTYTAMGVAVVLLAVLLGCTVLIKKGIDAKSALKPFAVLGAGLVAFTLLQTEVMGDGKLESRDAKIMWADSYDRLSASGMYKKEDFDVNSFKSVYTFMNTHTATIVKRFPLVGTGPENLVYAQIHKNAEEIDMNAGTFDKNYNEYLYIAATRGIPAAAALVVLLFAVIKNGRKNLKESCGWFDTSAITVVIGGAVILLIGNSNLTFSPIFWTVAGLCASPFVLSKKAEPSKFDKKTKKKLIK